jgi:multiple antibiotic resistance protein
MVDAVNSLFLILSALFPLVDPLSGSPLFLALTRECSPHERREIARRVAWDSFFLMIGSYLIGSHVLAFFGVSLPVVQVAGGLVVVGLGWTLLMEKEALPAQSQMTQPQDTIRRSFYPLTLPLTVGPGSISVAVTLGANATHHYGVHVAIIVAALIGTGLLAFSIYLCYGFADRLAQMFGETGTSVIIRLSSFLLVCIGVQIVWNGTSALISSVSLHVG